MRVWKDQAVFQPITIVIESQDELDQMEFLFASVAENKINHIPQLVTVARQMVKLINNAKEES
jgi:hypothetical protein